MSNDPPRERRFSSVGSSNNSDRAVRIATSESSKDFTILLISLVLEGPLTFFFITIELYLYFFSVATRKSSTYLNLRTRMTDYPKASLAKALAQA